MSSYPHKPATASKVCAAFISTGPVSRRRVFRVAVSAVLRGEVASSSLALMPSQPAKAANIAWYNAPSAGCLETAYTALARSKSFVFAATLSVTA